MGPSLIHLHSAAAVHDERLRVAGVGRRAKGAAPPAASAALHDRQLELVRLSVLMSRRRDPATHRRWA